MSEFTDRIQPTNSGLATYIDDLKSGKYQIPTFQRDVVWHGDNVKKLWDSIYKFYPLGSILIWKTDTKLQNHRSIGGHLIFDEKPRSEYQYILDGQQRTTSLLMSLYGGKIDGREKFDPQLYVDLTQEDKDDIDDDTYKSRFLYWTEIDDNDGTNKRNFQRMSNWKNGLIVSLHDVIKQNESLQQKVFETTQNFNSVEMRQLRHIREVIDNYRISFIEIKDIKVSEVCQIFERINQAGKPLDIFDIVVAKTFVPESAPKANDGFYLRDFIDGFRDRYSRSRFVDMSDLGYLQTLAVLVRENIPNSGVPTNSDYVLKHKNIDQNSLMNIAFITQSTNLDISNKNPIDYLNDYIDDSFVGIMPEHFLPEILLEWVADGKLPDDAISVFIERRIELIEADLREKLKGIDFQVIDTRV